MRLPFSLDPDYLNFTQAELNVIAEVWKPLPRTTHHSTLMLPREPFGVLAPRSGTY